MNRWQKLRLRALSRAAAPKKVTRRTREGEANTQSDKTKEFLQSMSVVHKLAVGGLFATLSIVGSLYTLWGPIWPTNPSTDPTDTEASDPIAIPIQVRNSSVLFPVYDLKISCGVESLKNDKGGGLSHLGLQTGAASKLEAASSNLFYCKNPFVYKDVKWLSADIYLNMTYKHRFFGIEWTGGHEEGPFIWQASLKPARWQKGALIR